MHYQLAPVEPVTLTGRFVRLEPLSVNHIGALAQVGLDPELWRLQPRPITNLAGMREYVMTALEEQRQGIALPFAIVDRASDRVIGSTRVADIVPADRRLEIGWTWLTPSHQRTPANTEGKLLLLTHAFEVLGALRVALKTDALNETSRRAILRIGATEEATFRKHRMTESGRVRDMVYFSILDTEWPSVKARLEERLAAKGTRSA